MNTKRHSRSKAAVALRYKARKDTAPKVTAKGKGVAAEKIIAVAQAHGIPVKEDPDLVQVLSQVEINHEVPPTVYKLVAELLAFVYQLNRDYRPPDEVMPNNSAGPNNKGFGSKTGGRNRVSS